MPRLEVFVEAAEAGEYIGIRPEAGGAAVIAWGRTPLGRRVAWLDGAALPAGMADATAAFLAALESSYGPRIHGIVRRELEMPPPGRPLPALLVRRAVRLAQDSRNMLAGINFMTRLSHSPRTGGEALRLACAAAGLAPEDLGSGRRALAEQLFQREFGEAARDDTLEVDAAAAQAILAEAIRRVAAIEEVEAAILAAKPVGAG